MSEQMQTRKIVLRPLERPAVAESSKPSPVLGALTLFIPTRLLDGIRIVCAFFVIGGQLRIVQLEDSHAALAPLFAAGHADPDSPVLAAAARSLGVSTQGLIAALTHAKLSLAGPAATQGPAGTKQGTAGTKQGTAGTKAGAAADKAGHDAMAAAVASDLHLAVARVSAALAPLFAAGGAEPDSPLLQAAARDLGVSAQQLNTALVHAKQSLASASQP